MHSFFYSSKVRLRCIFFVLSFSSSGIRVPAGRMVFFVLSSSQDRFVRGLNSNCRSFLESRTQILHRMRFLNPVKMRVCKLVRGIYSQSRQLWGDCWGTPAICHFYFKGATSLINSTGLQRCGETVLFEVKAAAISWVAHS